MIAAPSVNRQRFEYVKGVLLHVEFIPWVEERCTFSRKRAREYMKVANVKCHTRVTFDRYTFSEQTARDYMRVGKAKRQRAVDFERCTSIREVRSVGRLLQLGTHWTQDG